MKSKLKIFKKREFFKKLYIDSKSFLKHKQTLYLLRNLTMLMKVMKIHYDDSYTEHFNINKTLTVI